MLRGTADPEHARNIAPNPSFEQHWELRDARVGGAVGSSLGLDVVLDRIVNNAVLDPAIKASRSTRSPRPAMSARSPP